MSRLIITYLSFPSSTASMLFPDSKKKKHISRDAVFLQCGWAHQRSVWKYTWRDYCMCCMESLTEKREAELALDIPWSSHGYEHDVFFSHLFLTTLFKSSDMNVYWGDRPEIGWMFQRSFKQATRTAPHPPTQFSPTTNPPLILEVGLQLAKERKYRVHGKVKGLMAKNSHTQRLLMAFPSPDASSLLLPFRVPKRACLEGEINPSPDSHQSRPDAYGILLSGRSCTCSFV